MIKIRLAAQEIDLRDQELPIVAGETLHQAIQRILDECKIAEDPKDILQATVNGHLIEKDFWDFTKLNPSDSVVVAPRIKDGDSGQLLGQILIIAAVAFSAGTLAPALGITGAFGTAFLNGAVGIIAGYAVSQLIPPPSLDQGGAQSDYSTSQMFSVTSQSNQVKKFGNVPKVYGEHRIYPLVAANPYTDLETDPTTGKLVQYLYAIYDFGLGPNLVTDIKIGDTPIQSFSDVNFRLVDFNRPVTSEGIWDDDLENNLIYYKGDFSSDSVNVTLNGNQVNGGPLDTYQLTRNAGDNPENAIQEIGINFIIPQGLFALNSNGTTGSRSIDLDIFFSKQGEENWVPYNSLAYCDGIYSAGGDVSTANAPLALAGGPAVIPGTGIDSGQYPVDVTKPRLLTETPYTVSAMRNGTPFKSKKKITVGYYQDSIIFIEKNNNLVIGDVIVDGAGNYYGTVFDINTLHPTRDSITLSNLSTKPFHLYTYIVTRYEQADGPYAIGDTTYTANAFPYLKRSSAIAGRLRITSSSREQTYASVKFSPKVAGEYKVRVTRVRSVSNFTSTVFDAMSVINLNTRLNSSPINTTKRHTFLELRIKASGQLNGAIQNLSAVCTSVLDVWNGSAWVKSPTSNPAWVYADILTGEVNKRAIDKSRLHLPSLIEWADHCDEVPTSGTLYNYVEERFRCNFVLDFSTTVQQLLNQVAGAAQASFNIIDGKYGVLLDVNRSTPVQIFTTRNSSGFSSTRLYSSRPHALKVSFVDPNADWQQNELIVYDDTYDATTATEFEDIQTFACTSVEQSFRFGRYFMAQNKLRQETMTLKVDFEHLVCTRGDFVQIAQDTMKVGGTPARVKSVSGNQIVIDEGIETDNMLNYGYVFRNSSTGNIDTDTLTVDSSDTFTLDGVVPNVGDLIIIGETTKIVFDCIVKSISPNDDMSATLQLVEKAEAIYDIESIDIIPEYNPELSSTIDGNFLPPPEVENLVVVENTYRVLSSGYEYYIDIDWEPSLGSAYELFEIYLDNGSGYDLVSSTKNTDHRQIIDVDDLGNLHSFKVLAVSATGKKLSLGEVSEVSATPISKITPPSNVEIFNSDITNEVIQLFWQRVPDLDIKEYVIRFSPDVNGLWESSTVLMRASGNDSLISTQARTGTYLIKAIDFNDNESLIAGAIITTIPELNGLNIITTENDFPTLLGTSEQLNKSGGTLIISEAVSGPVGTEQYYPEGYYYYNDLLDLTEIYTVRLQSLLKAEGFTTTDIMANWITLDSVLLLYTPSSSDWDVEAQYRGTNSLNTMSDWVTLSSILVISQGSEDNWTAWRKFIIGDVTARILQFRLKLISNALNISPRVLDGAIKADMPDRVESYNNLLAPDTGLEVLFSPEFKGPVPAPSVQISLENGQSGDYWEFNYKDTTGFEIVFYNNLNNPVARQFDAQVKGFGRKATATI